MSRLSFHSQYELDTWYSERLNLYDAKRALDREAFMKTLNTQYARYAKRIPAGAMTEIQMTPPVIPVQQSAQPQPQVALSQQYTPVTLHPVPQQHPVESPGNRDVSATPDELAQRGIASDMLAQLN